MKVKKIINNNVALIDRGGNEAIIYMTGIAFKKKVGQRINAVSYTHLTLPTIYSV